jgi:hypothetical protein
MDALLGRCCQAEPGAELGGHRRRPGYVLVVVAWAAPRVPPNIADSREIRTQGPFLTPARFPHRRNRDSRGCFHTRARTRLPGTTCRQPGRAHEAAGWSTVCQVHWLVRAVICWLPVSAGANRRREQDLPTWLRSSTTRCIPDTGGRFPTGVLGRTVAGRGTYEGPARHLGSVAGHSRRQMANWTCLARRGCRPTGAAVRRPVPPVDGARAPGAGHLWGLRCRKVCCH